MFHRDNPTAEVQTRRFADILVKCYGKENAKKAKHYFSLLLMDFHKMFDKDTASEPSNWNPFIAFKPLLCLASSVGDFCQKGCGKIHTDLFSHDDC